MKVTGAYLIKNDLIDPSSGYTIDPKKEYWYDPFTGLLHEPPSWRQRLLYATPWMRWRHGREWKRVERERRAILEWELSQLPEGFLARRRTPIRNVACTVSEHRRWPGLVLGRCAYPRDGR